MNINLKMERQGCKHMNHLSKKVLPGVILLLAILISACSFSTSSTSRRNGTYASAAQTTVSQEASQDVTNQQLATDESAIPSVSDEFAYSYGYANFHAWHDNLYGAGL